MSLKPAAHVRKKHSNDVFQNQKLSFEVEGIDYQGCIETKKVAVMCKIYHQCCLEHLSAAFTSQILVHMGFVVLNRKKPLK